PRREPAATLVQPPGADLRPVRPTDHVCGRRHGHRDNNGTDGMNVELNGGSALVTGGASGLGLATVKQFVARGTPVVIVDLPTSQGEAIAKDLGELAAFAPADVTDPTAVDAALDLAQVRGPVRALVHCAGRGGTVRVVERDGSP